MNLISNDARNLTAILEELGYSQLKDIHYKYVGMYEKACIAYHQWPTDMNKETCDRFLSLIKILEERIDTWQSLGDRDTFVSCVQHITCD